MSYVIISESGERLQVDAPNWMMAMGRAMSRLELSGDAMGRWKCSSRPDGAIVVEDPVENTRWLILEASAESAQPMEESAPAVASEPIAEPAAETNEEEPDTLAERLFDLSFQIASAGAEEAADLALELLQEFIPCEASSVVRGTLNDTALNIISASGPVGGRVKGMTIPFGHGIVGLCFDVGISVQVDDVALNENHLSSVDGQTGFSTKATLCVPIRDDSHNLFGVIQLINPQVQLLDWHIECAETVARTLSGPLDAA